MPALSDRKIEVVRTLVESAPDQIVGGLHKALSETGEDSTLAPVRQLVEVELADRLLRNSVFLPVAPLCIGDGTHAQKLTFPARALALVWRGLKVAHPQDIAAAVEAARALAAAQAAQQRLPDPSKTFDAIVLVALGALRDGQGRDFQAAAELLDKARPGGAKAFCACLDISPIVRRAIPRLAEWVAQPAAEVSAAARLAFKDSVAIDEDGGPRFFEMLAAHIAPSWMVLRVISAIMDKPTERYLHDSELGGFAERVLADIDFGLKAIGALDLDAGPGAARVAAQRVGLVTEQTFELEVCVELTRDHGWGRHVFEQKQALAGVVERILKEAEKQLAQALPTPPSRVGRGRKPAPRFDGPPDARAVARTVTALAFAHEVRPFAGHGGFSASHAKAMEKLGHTIDEYVEDAVDIARAGDVDAGLVQAYLAAVAEFMGHIRDRQASELIRRRAAATRPNEPPSEAAEA